MFEKGANTEHAGITGTPPEPATRYPEPKTRNPIPEISKYTRDLIPENRNIPESPGLEPGTRNMPESRKPFRRKPKSETRNRTPGPGISRISERGSR